MAKKKTSKRVKKSVRRKTIAPVTNSEWKVLTVLWNRGPVTVSQVRASLKQKWTLGAIRSFLDRLVEKKLARLLDDEPIYRFEAVCDCETLLREKSRIFLEQYFGGSFHDFALFYLAEHKIPPKKVDDFIKLLKSQSKRK